MIWLVAALLICVIAFPKTHGVAANGAQAA